MKVWIVWGKHNDESRFVVSVFSTPEEAQKCADDEAKEWKCETWVTSYGVKERYEYE